ncbi:MAG: SDR family oxidoreductase [Pirellulales bacterium]|nr:SDR family oxidoreductase [Pirellulales bacterium]
MKNSPDRAVLITGASTGIGEACALELDRLGWRVFAGVRNDPAGQRLGRRASARLTPVMLDVTEAEQVAAVAAMLAETLGDRGLFGLVNNAGVAVAGPLEALSLDQLRRQFEVNVVGQVAVTQAVLPLIRRAAGRIVMIGSLNGRLATPYLGPYAASKFALEAITDAWRIELRRWKIGVSIVEPGTVLTPIWDKAVTNTQELTETIPPEMMELYGDDIRAMQELTAKLVARGMSVSRVVRAVLHALTAGRPKTRYPVGIETRLLIAGAPFAPDRFRDRIIRRFIGLD